MKIISFAWTTPALLASQKTVTRRDWKKAHALSFHADELVQAYDRGPRIGGHQVATIRLTQDPYLEYSTVIPPLDWFNEGFDYLMNHGITLNGLPALAVWEGWHTKVRLLWVVRFNLIEITKK